MKLHIFWCLMYIPYFLTIMLLLILIQNFGFIVLSLQTLPNISLPWNLMTTSIDVLFNACLWINLMSAIYWMCYLFHSICGKRKPWIKLNGQGTNWSQPCHSHCWFYHRHPVIKWPFEIQKFYHPKKHQPLLLFTFIQTLIHWSKEIVLFYILTKKYLYFIILYILLLSRASSAMRETSIPGRERLSRNSVEKVQLLLLFCD